MKQNWIKKQRSIYLPKAHPSTAFSFHLHENIAIFRSELGNSSDLSIRECKIGTEKISAAILWINGMVDQKTVNETVLNPLLQQGQQLNITEAENVYELLRDSIIYAQEVSFEQTVDLTISRLLLGYSILLVHGFAGGIAINTQGYEVRSIEEPASSAVLRGPRDGFIESLAINLSLIRRRIKNKKLRVETHMIGSVSHTQVAILYLQDLAQLHMVDEVRKRLDHIQIDAVLESQYIEELIKDSGPSIFPTVYSTERPDDITGGLLEGRVAILIDGTPFALLMPCTFFHLMKTSEDYYLAYPVATFIRWIRFIGFFTTLLFPAIYVGVLTFHPEIVPSSLLGSILAAREGIPFPLLIEALMMELVFDGLREASIRLPKTIGSTISIVGALVIGEAAVNAGIISSPTVIVVAGTAISSFTIPSIDLSGAIRLLRYFMLFWSSILGIYGIFIGLILLGIHMSTLRSLDIPYLAPIAPYKSNEAWKTILRIPWWFLRPKYREKNRSRER